MASQTADNLKKQTTPRPKRKPAPAISQTVKNLRLDSKMTLNDLARRSGLAASTLSKIENGQMSPTFDTMVSLAEGLNVDVGELVRGGRGMAVNGRKAVTRRGAGAMHSNEQYDYEMLCTEIASRQFIPIVAEIKAHSVKSFEQLINHPGEEFVYVLEGRVEIHTEYYSVTTLEEGDCCYFDSTMGHALVNPDPDTCRVLWICSRVVAPLSEIRFDGV